MHHVVHDDLQNPAQLLDNRVPLRGRLAHNLFPPKRDANMLGLIIGEVGRLNFRFQREVQWNPLRVQVLVELIVVTGNAMDSWGFSKSN